MAAAPGKRRMGRTGLYERASARSPTVARRRFFFLLAVKKCEPRVLADLQRSVLPLFKRAHARYARGAAANAFLARYLARTDPIAKPDEFLAPLHDALLKWAGRWNLTAGWCLRYAVEAMGYALHRPRRRLTWGVGGTMFVPALTPAERRFVFKHDGWEPTRQRRSVAAAAIRAAFDDQLRRYLARLDKTARERGFSPMPGKREGLHFDWLARYQVRGERFTAIKESAPHVTSAKAVEVAVKDLAHFIGLPLRPAPRGRPPAGSRAARDR